MPAKYYETWCPLFPGFYESEFEYNGEEQDIESYNEENKTDLKWDDFNFNYKDYHQRVSRAFANKMESELNSIIPVKMEFQELYSPKEYNFYTDSIWCKVRVSIAGLIKLINNNRTEAAAIFKSKYTSCSGFISFHSSQIKDWIDRKYILQDPRHRVGALLECLAEIEGIAPDSDWTSNENWIDFSVNEKQLTNK